MPATSLTEPSDETAKSQRKLTLLFIFTYLSHGIATQFGLIAQPFQFYLKQGLHMSASEVSSILAFMMWPWVWKPFLCTICDFVPLFGYRRKSYLILVNAFAAAAFIIMSMTDSLSLLKTVFLLSAVAMSASTAITVGLAAEGGRSNGKARDYFSLQTICYYAALMSASLAGGYLCHLFAPEAALHVAAACAVVPVTLISVTTVFLLKEEKASVDWDGFKASLVSLKTVVTTRSLWLVALFIWCWDFSPSFGIPLYFFESNTLKFSQSLIGQLGACMSFGMLCGAIVYRFYLSKMPMTRLLYLAIAMGATSTLAYLGLSTPASAVGLELFRGFANMVTILALYALAADVCPLRTEVTVMASLLAVRNLATEGSTYIGGQLFEKTFHNQLAPLVVVATLLTAACAFIIPFLRNHDRSLQSRSSVAHN